MTKHCLTTGLLAVCLLAAAAWGQKADAEAKALAGTWGITSHAMDGDDIPEEVAKQLSLTFADGKVTLTGGVAKQGTTYVPLDREVTFDVKFGTAGKLKTIDLIEKRAKGRTLPGIYRLEKGKLTLAINFEDKTRPEKFESKEDSGIAVFGAEKAKK